ncbi:MAG: hypothetical protein R6U96_08775 [Promethearchaeia archaeon]
MIKIVILSRDPISRFNFHKISEIDPDIKVFGNSRGDSGERLILSQKPQLIVMSPFLPGKGGIQLCKQLRKMARFTSTRIIGLRKYRGEERLGKIPQAGFDSFLTTPVRKEKIYDLLQLHFNYNRVPDSLPSFI